MLTVPLYVEPANLFFFMTRVRPVNEAREYLTNLAETFPEANIFASGNPRLLSELKYPGQVKWLKDVHDFENVLQLNN